MRQLRLGARLLLAASEKDIIFSTSDGRACVLAVKRYHTGIERCPLLLNAGSRAADLKRAYKSSQQAAAPTRPRRIALACHAGAALCCALLGTAGHRRAPGPIRRAPGPIRRNRSCSKPASLQRERLRETPGGFVGLPGSWPGRPRRATCTWQVELGTYCSAFQRPIAPAKEICSRMPKDLDRAESVAASFFRGGPCFGGPGLGMESALRGKASISALQGSSCSYKQTIGLGERAAMCLAQQLRLILSRRADSKLLSQRAEPGLSERALGPAPRARPCLHPRGIEEPKPRSGAAESRRAPPLPRLHPKRSETRRREQRGREEGEESTGLRRCGAPVRSSLGSRTGRHGRGARAPPRRAARHRPFSGRTSAPTPLSAGTLLLLRA